MDYSLYKGRGIPRFPANSRVCFLGDSLTASALWTEIVFEYYLRNFPEDRVRMYNVGTGGGTARYELEHFDEDVMRYAPTHAVVMYSVNDIGSYTGEAAKREECFYADMRELTERLISRGVTVYFMCPEEIADEPCFDGARRIAHDVMARLAEEYGIYLCDLYTVMTPLVGCADMIQPDRTHRTPVGDSVVGRIFLHLQGFDGFTPRDADFFDTHVLDYDVDHRKIFNDKIRRIWCTMRNISTDGDTVEAKIERLRGRIVTRADGAWDDFCYYRAVDFIELYPNLEFYHEMADRLTEKLITDGIK